MLKEKKEKNWLLSIIKFLRDKLKELIKKIFARDLSFDQRLDKEIKELQEKLNSGELSEEEFARALERLTALQDLKLRLQMAVVGWIVTMFAEMFGVELAAAVEASTEKEDKKAEKTSLKEEAIKKVHKDVEIKVDEREKPKVPVSLFDASPGFVRPVPLSKPELDLLPKPIMPSIFKEVINNENREVKETKPKVEEEKKAKPEEEVCPPAPKTATNTYKRKLKGGQGCNSGRQTRKDLGISNPSPNGKVSEQPNQASGSTSGKSAQESVSGREVPSQSAKSPVLNGKASEQPNQARGSAVEKSASNIGAKKQSVERFDFTIGFWNGPENESSVNNAQAKISSELTGPKANNLAEGQSAGKT